jgi:hypothetical protein
VGQSAARRRVEAENKAKEKLAKGAAKAKKPAR